MKTGICHWWLKWTNCNFWSHLFSPLPALTVWNNFPLSTSLIKGNLILLVWRGNKGQAIENFHLLKIPVSQSLQSCPILCNPLDCSLPGSSGHGILQARILEWVAILFSRGIFSAQGLNLGLHHCRQILYHLSHQGSLTSTELFKGMAAMGAFLSLYELYINRKPSSSFSPQKCRTA